ncbi:MAG: HNH endonuclease signature motif containing protein, partial [Nocardioides sp.]
DAAEIRRAATCDRPACRTGREPCTHEPTGPGLGPPPDTPGYSPGARLDAFTRARDRRCRFPGCRTRAERCDLDHTTVWPHGATSEDNLCCLCRHHHRLRHQAPGWSLRRLPDGGLEWTLPGGNTITTHPPRHGTDDPPPPNPPPPETESSQPPPLDPPLTARERVLGRPLPPGAVDDDPPPF